MGAFPGLSPESPYTHPECRLIWQGGDLSGCPGRGSAVIVRRPR